MTETIQILFEDQDLVVITKPSGVVTNRAKSVTGETLQDWFNQYLSNQPWPTDWQSQLPADFSIEYGTPEEIFQARGGMVHRLDKDTSGVMVFAKHPGSLLNLLTQFGQHLVQKEYLALTHGKFRVEQGRLTAPLARSQTNRQKFAVSATGREAITEYQVEKVFKTFNWPVLAAKIGESSQLIVKQQRLYEQGFSLVRCLPKTGRTHQIRVHLSHEQHPLVGDVKYIGRKRAKLDPLWCFRQFLHAGVLQFSHPRTGQPVRFEAALSQDLATVLTLLQPE